KPAAGLLDLSDDVREHRVSTERPIVNLVVDPRDIHHGDAAGAQVEVSDFAVAHLTGRQSDPGTARSDETSRIPLENRLEHGSAREPDGVVSLLLPLAEA